MWTVLFYSKSNLDDRSIVHRDKNSFKEIRDYLKQEKIKSKLMSKGLYHILETHTYKHYFSNYNFNFLIEKDYKKLKMLECFKRYYEDLK